jgi:hypothetical protein
MTWKPEGRVGRKKPLSQHDELIKEMRMTRALLSSIAGLTPKISRHTQNSNRTESQWVCQRCKHNKATIDAGTSDFKEDPVTAKEAIIEDSDIAATIEHPVKPTPKHIQINTATTTVVEDDCLISPARSVDLECLPDDAPPGIVAWEAIPLTSPLAKRHCTSLSNIASETSQVSQLGESSERSPWYSIYSQCTSQRIDEILDVLVDIPDPEGMAWNIARTHYGKYLRNKKTVNKRCVCAVCTTHVVDRDRPVIKWSKFGFTSANESLVNELSPYRTMPIPPSD